MNTAVAQDVLTRTAQVLKVLQAGGHIRTQVDAQGNQHLAHLLDFRGFEVRAWQAAITRCLLQCVRCSNLQVQDGARIGLWRLPPTEQRHD